MSSFGLSSVPEKDHEVTPGPTDGVSQVAWSPTMDFLSVSSWSNQINIYEMGCQNYQVMSQPKFSYAHEAPALCTAFTADGTKVMSGGCDKAVRLYDMNSQQAIQVGSHDAPVKGCGAVNNNVIVSASWDKTVRYWDMRSPNPIASVQLPEKVYAMDISGNTMAIACAERYICVFKFDDPGRIWKTINNPALKWQTRSIGVMQDGAGYAIGSIEGRVAIGYFDDVYDKSNSFTFKCHRDGTAGVNVYAVNGIAFTPEGTFATCGSDGTCTFWCKDSRTRLKNVTPASAPISTCRFNRDGRMFAYAVSYDWSKGYEDRKPGDKDTVLVKAVRPEEIRRKPAKAR